MGSEMCIRDSSISAGSKGLQRGRSFVRSGRPRIVPRPRLEPSKAMVRADEVFVAEGHEATRYSGGFLPLQWLVAGWCGKQLHKVAVRVMNVDLLEPVRPVLRPVCDCNPGGL